VRSLDGADVALVSGILEVNTLRCPPFFETQMTLTMSVYGHTADLLQQLLWQVEM
jgi:hypothetical protein